PCRSPGRSSRGSRAGRPRRRRPRWRRRMPDLRIVGAWAGAPPADIALLLPFIDGSQLAGLLGYLLNSVAAAYPETHDPIWNTLTPRGLQMANWTQHICLVQTIADYAFRHVQFWFHTDPMELITEQDRNQPSTLVFRRWRTRHAMGRRPIQRPAHHTELCTDLTTAGARGCSVNSGSSQIATES